jgi:hypothetical protein
VSVGSSKYHYYVVTLRCAVCGARIDTRSGTGVSARFCGQACALWPGNSAFHWRRAAGTRLGAEAEALILVPDGERQLAGVAGPA